MRAVFLRTHTPDCEKFWLSWESLGLPYEIRQYDDRPHEEQPTLVEEVKALEPDVIVYLGAIEAYHERPVLLPNTLCKLRELAPTVHICGDGSDQPWWRWLDHYDRMGCFNVQVNVDGNRETPIAGYGSRGLITLTPVDPRPFTPKPWRDRHVIVGMAGGQGHGERAALIAHLVANGGMVWLNGVSYTEMADFMSGCRLIANSPRNGTGDKDHVKGRVLETGWAGACLLERKNEHTAFWFQPHVEYLEYVDNDDAVEKVRWAAENPEKVRQIAERLHKRVAEDHAPRQFWSAVLERCGLKLETAA